MRRVRQILSSVITTLILVGLGFVMATMLVPELTRTIAGAIDDVEPPAITESEALAQREAVFNDIYSSVSPSVVSINIAAERSMGLQNVSSGSGFVVSNEGHIVTNYHVIANSDRIEVRMFDGTVTAADVVGTDPDSDLAVIQVDVPQERLAPVSFGDSNDLQIGDSVLAIGNPFQNDWTLTAGIVSALNRSIQGLDRFSIGGVIQTDAAINPGNSGGPLINLHGEVIGVNSQIESRTRSNSGVGFAVPSNLVRKVANSLIETGEMRYSFLGITAIGDGISLDLIEEYNLPDNIQGVPILEVDPTSGAGEAGLQGVTETAISIITAIDGTPMNDFDELIAYLSQNTNPGDTVTLTVRRNGDVRQVDVNLTNRPGVPQQ
jgi:2-alkenal reductase